MSIGPRFAPASSRRAPSIAKVAAALCAAVLVFGPRIAFGQQFRFFGTESFGFGRTQFGLGSSYLSELQKSLIISSSSGTVTVHDLDLGTTETNPLDGDPRLLNRKFDLEWSVRGPGVQMPITLLDLHAGSWAQISSMLTLQALEGDFDLRFLNQREPTPSDSLQGRAPQYSLELGLTGNLGGKWFAEGGYRFQDIPTADAERSRPFASPGLQVLSDKSRVSRETHDAITHLGYSFSGDEVRTYTGVRLRWTHLEVEDELRLLNPLFSQETTLRSKTELDSRATEAIVGVEAHRGSFIGRTEFTFNDQDYGVLATVVYKFSEPPSPDEQLERELDEIAVRIAPDLARIAEEFARNRERLQLLERSGGSPAQLLSEIVDLLDRTESDLLKVLKPHPSLGALVDWLVERFRQARQDLQRVRPESARIALASLQQDQRGTTSNLFDSVLTSIQTVCLLIKSMGEEKAFDMKLTFKSECGSGVWLQIYPPYNPNQALRKTWAARQTSTVARGMYSYLLYSRQVNSRCQGRACDVTKSDPRDPPCPFDLVVDPLPVLYCDGNECRQQNQ